MECIDPNRRGQDLDNYNWIRDAEKNNLVVGTQARILYQDAAGRMKIALKFNEMVRNGEVGPIMLGRDHHDVSGTDSPFRETSNIKDGSNVMADMAVQCFAGNCARGMSLVALHNGGGVGIGKAINGGFGMVCDGSERGRKYFVQVRTDAQGRMTWRGAYGLLSEFQDVFHSEAVNLRCGSSADAPKAVELSVPGRICSEPDAAAGRTDYDTDMGIWNERLLRLPEFLHERQGWGTDGICKFRMGTDGYKEGDSGQSDKRNLGCIRIGPTASHAVQRAENYAAGKI